MYGDRIEFVRMKLTEEYGDLFDVNWDIAFKGEPYCLAHCISADLEMSGVVSEVINKKWKMQNVLLRNYGDQQENFKAHGPSVFPVRVNHQTEQIYVYNLIAKQKASQKCTYVDLRKSLELMRDHMVANECFRVAIPTLGCGYDGLDWSQVKSIIMEVFDDTRIEIRVCKLTHYFMKVISVEDITAKCVDYIRNNDYPNYESKEPVLKVVCKETCYGYESVREHTWMKSEYEKYDEQGYYIE